VWNVLFLCLLAADPAAWWESYGDSTLTTLVVRALEHNADVRIAGARLAEARAASGDARSALLPAVNFNASAQQIRGGFQNGVIRITPGAGPGSGASLISPFETKLLASSFDSRWEVSFWSGVAKRFRAAKAEVVAAGETLADLRLIVSAETARAYFELRSFERQLAAARRNRTIQAELLELIEDRARAGLAPELDVERQRAVLATADAAIKPLEWQCRVRLHRLALLTNDRDLVTRGLPAATQLHPRLPPLGAGVDSALLARRPDVRAAQARILAAMARRAAAKADFLPRLLLTGLAGRQGTNVSGLSLGAGNFFGVGPQLVLPVFTGGRLRAQVEAADARLEQARLEYERELLAAFLEAEDAIAGYRAQCDRLVELNRAHRAASAAMELAAELYRAGAGDYLSVLEAQRAVLDLELALAEASGSAAVQSALLYKALAGGWPQEPGT
jgi:NodT family efflux transporter outer membrane factor (OMF) lipoprotein